MASAADPDLFKVPVIALRTSTREIISTLLNPPKVIPTEEGLPRDWRGLAQLVGLNSQMITLISTKSDPSGQVLSQWKNGSLGQLRSFLGQLDRWDIADDTERIMELDAFDFLKRKDQTPASASELNPEIDKQILTVADVYRLEQGLEPQHYDAFLLFADEDQDFAMQIVDRMELDYGLKLCLRDRDLVGGLTFEHEAIMRLIAKRCNRLIVIASPSFLKSEANKFFVTFATALGIDQRSRKVVPVMYQKCQLPPELTYYFWLDYSRAGKLYDFWTRLHNSVQSTTNVQQVKKIVYERSQVPAIKDIGEESSSFKVSPLPEKDKIETPKLKELDTADTCSLRSELSSLSSISSNHSSKSELPLLRKQQKSSSVEFLKSKSPSQWLRKILPKRKPQLTEAT